MEHTGKNPLLISLVLDEIFQNLQFSIDDYKNYRLVCKTWNEVTLKLWRSKCAICLGPTGNLNAHLEWPLELCSAWNVEDLFRTFTNHTNYVRLDKTPYSKYVFKGLVVDSTEIIGLLNDLWNTVGPLMKQIWFEDCYFPTFDANYLVTLLSKKLKNIDSLVFVDCKSQFLVEDRHITPADFPPQAERNMSLQKLKVIGGLPIDLFSLLLHCPNLQTLKLYSGANRPPVNGTHFYRNFAETCKLKNTLNDQPFKIRHLTIKLKMKQLSFDIDIWIRQINLPCLEDASINNYPGFPKCASVLKLLVTQHAANLRKFKVFELHKFFIQYLEVLSRMSSLEELYLYGDTILSLSFLESMPQLRVLYLEFKYYNALDKLRKSTGSSTMMWTFVSSFLITKTVWTVPAHNLEIFHCDLELGRGTLNIVAEWMPNLKTLEVVLRSSAFREVCTLMPNLENLILLYGSEVCDKDITGYPDDRSRGPRNPGNLTALTNLRKFEVKRTCANVKKSPSSPYRIGDKSVYKGFLELHHLSRVSIHVVKMRKLAETALRNHVSSVEIIRSYQPGSHGSGECCKVVKYIDDVNRTSKEYMSEVRVRLRM